MSQRIPAFLICLSLALLCGGRASGQVIDFSQDKPQRQQSPFAQRLWYGGGVNIGFSGSGAVNTFQFGLSPMVGYKFFEPFSVGPRIFVQYNYYKAQTGNGSNDTAQPISWGAGVFMRYKVFPMIFAHVEYEFVNQPYVQVGLDELEVFRERSNNVYVGGGYTSGQGLGSLGYELSVLFNLAQEETASDLPFIIRVGITYNF